MAVMKRPILALLCLSIVATATFRSVFATDGQKIEVTSERVEHSATGGKTQFIGSVVVLKGGMELRAETLDVDKAGKHFVAKGAPIKATCKDCADFLLRGDAGTRLEYDDTAEWMHIRGGLEICADAGCEQGTLSADSMEWQQAEDIITLQGAPEVDIKWRLESGDWVHATAATVVYHPRKGDVQLRGQARILRGESDVAGDLIDFNMKTGSLSARSLDDQPVKATFGGDDE